MCQQPNTAAARHSSSTLALMYSAAVLFTNLACYSAAPVLSTTPDNQQKMADLSLSEDLADNSPAYKTSRMLNFIVAGYFAFAMAIYVPSMYFLQRRLQANLPKPGKDGNPKAGTATARLPDTMGIGSSASDRRRRCYPSPSSIATVKPPYGVNSSAQRSRFGLDNKKPLPEETFDKCIEDSGTISSTAKARRKPQKFFLEEDATQMTTSLQNVAFSAAGTAPEQSGRELPSLPASKRSSSSSSRSSSYSSSYTTSDSSSRTTSSSRSTRSSSRSGSSTLTPSSGSRSSSSTLEKGSARSDSRSSRSYVRDRPVDADTALRMSGSDSAPTSTSNVISRSNKTEIIRYSTNAGASSR